MNKLTVESVGVLALLQDRGRRGLAHLGVGQSGAADRASFGLANRLVGNQPGAPCIELTLGRMSFRVAEPALIAVTGAPTPISCRGRQCGPNAAFVARAGDSVTIGAATDGLRTYVAVRGGLVGQAVLGSMSWDTMAQLGTPPLQPGDVLEFGEAQDHWPAVDFAPTARMCTRVLRLPLLLGPRDDLFTDAALARLACGEFIVTSDTDRVGIRLDGPDLPRRRTGELASEGVVLGALQVPTRGRPTLFLADRPVTGGYPVIGVVPERALDAAAQAVPGSRIRFAPYRLR
jgi:biotin-dependent carboxylase-like uncharacterized protein